MQHNAEEPFGQGVELNEMEGIRERLQVLLNQIREIGDNPNTGNMRALLLEQEDLAARWTFRLGLNYETTEAEL